MSVPRRPEVTPKVDVAVVGAGISGLTLAFHLRRQGARVVLLEKANEVGGTLRSVAREGFVLELGANTFVDKEPATRRLLRAAGLENRIREAEAIAHKRYLFVRGRLHLLPDNPASFVTSRVLSARGKWRLLREPLSPRGPNEDEPLARFATRHLGEEAARVLFDALQSGVYAGDLDALSAQAAFPSVYALAQAHRSLVLGMVRSRTRALARGEEPALTFRMCSLDGGLGLLPTTLASDLGSDLQLGAEVKTIDRVADGYRLVLEGSAWEAARVALATPAPVTARLVERLDAGLAARLRDIPYAPVAAVHLAYSATDAAQVPPGFGVLAPSSEGLDVLGVLFISAAFPWRAPQGQVLLTAMVGGARRPDLVQAPDEVLSRKVQETLARVLKVRGTPSFVHTVRWPAAIPQYNVGHLTRVEQIEKHMQAHEGLSLLGNAYRGVGLNDCIRDAESFAARIGPRSARSH
jgi:protoporphyrinogen/coproporphyrinogen III oxidase